MGSNIDPDRNLPLAIARLAQLGRVVALSNVYQNPAVSQDPQPDYLNAALALEVDHSPSQLQTALREIEQALGRVRSEDKYAPRTIDLDLVMMDDRVDPDAGLPDPEIVSLPHLAIPLAELAPDLRVPPDDVPLQTIADRLQGAARMQLRQEMTERLRAVVASTDDLDPVKRSKRQTSG